jgi:dehydrogenase/reductase SDR family protein 1
VPVAIVTGASRGVGRGVAIALGRSGWKVYVTGRTLRAGESRWPGSIEETAQAVTAAGGVGIAIRSDSNVDSDLADLVARVVAESSGIDVLINSAYGFPDQFQDTPRGIDFWELPIALWDSQMGTSLRAHYVMSSLVAPHMIHARSGLIVNMSSRGGDGYLFNVPYGVAKAAIERMTVDMAIELAPHGATAVALRPGPVLTERISATPWNGTVSPKRSSPLSVGRAVLELIARPAAQIGGQVFDSQALGAQTLPADFDYLAA